MPVGLEHVRHVNARIIGQRIKALRQQHDWSQEELARRVGHHRVTIAKIEGGEMFPKLEHALDLARLFGIHVGELLEVQCLERPWVSPRLLDILLALRHEEGGRFLAQLRQLVDTLERLPRPAGAAEVGCPRTPAP